jgi:type 2 lantibiotic biosynthesis protein LanM
MIEVRQYTIALTTEKTAFNSEFTENREEPAPLDQVLLLEGWSLHERLQVASACVSPPGLPIPAAVEQHLAAWRQVVDPYCLDSFDKRLQWDGLTHANAAWALHPEKNKVPQQPSWWNLLAELRDAARNVAIASVQVNWLAERGKACPFVHAWRPVACWALQMLQGRCTGLSTRLQLENEAWLDLGEALLQQLSNIADRALWELFNQCRTPGQMLLAHLGEKRDGVGEPVREAYDAFIGELLAKGYEQLLGKYPVLGRLLSTAIELWLQASEEMLFRVAENRDCLNLKFGISASTPLVAVQPCLSDPHRGGRAVAILRFGSGEGVKQIVYKPKDMHVDLVYQQFLHKLNQASTLEPLRCFTVVNKLGYGFMEWVEHKPCKNEDELARFYTNAGRIMAVLHLLRCTDCHHENMIASGDQLVLVDAETILESDQVALRNDIEDHHCALSDLQISIQASVLRSGMLPHWVMSGANRRVPVDISALGVKPPPAERYMPGWLALNSDGMMPGSSIQPCKLPTSLPVSLGDEQQLTNFVNELCEGFNAQLCEAIRHKPLLLDALQAFRGKPRRLVVRATRLYSTIHRQMLEPASLRSAVDFGIKLEQLSRSYLLASKQPLSWPLFHAEVIQMMQLDIPFFEHQIDSEDLFLPNRMKPIAGFMKKGGISAARLRLRNLDQVEIDFQQQLIRGAIAARHLIIDHASIEDVVSGQSADFHAAPTAYILRQEAFRLGEELWAKAVRDHKGRPEWLGIDLAADGGSFFFGVIGPSLYSGFSGIALLFARMAVATIDADSEKWRQRACACFEGLEQLTIGDCNDKLFRIVRDMPYGISGIGGIILALTLLDEAKLLGISQLKSVLLQQVRPERIALDDGVDVIGGVAGLIGPLLLQHQAQALALAVACGDRLLTLQLDNGGWPSYWSKSNGRKRAWTGFSHGAAGMAAALARLAQASGEPRFADAARRALFYEQSVYVSDQGNWPDFRRTDDSKHFMLSWCHGAPGILMSRLVIKASGIDDGLIAADISAARVATVEAMIRLSTSAAETPSHICCGLLGLTSLLRVDAEISGIELDPRVNDAERQVVRRALATGAYTFTSVDAGSLDLPSLFTGKAGVAFSLLEAVAGQRWMSHILSAGLWPAC